jgi:hypothetical protein
VVLVSMDSSIESTIQSDVITMRRRVDQHRCTLQTRFGRSVALLCGQVGPIPSRWCSQRRHSDQIIGFKVEHQSIAFELDCALIDRILRCAMRVSVSA